MPSTMKNADNGHDALNNFSTREKYNVSVLLKDQYSASRPKHLPGDEDPLDAINVNYEDHTLTKKQRMEAQLASLNLKRRTRFQAIPVKRNNSV